MARRHTGFDMHMIRPEPSSKVSEDSGFEPSYIPKFINSEDFIKKKVEMLREHFCINLTERDIDRLRDFKTENEINAAVKGILNKYWG